MANFKWTCKHCEKEFDDKALAQDHYDSNHGQGCYVVALKEKNEKLREHNDRMKTALVSLMPTLSHMDITKDVDMAAKSRLAKLIENAIKE